MSKIKDSIIILLLFINVSAILYEIYEEQKLKEKYKTDNNNQKNDIKESIKNKKKIYDNKYLFIIHILNYFSLYLCILLFISLLIDDNPKNVDFRFCNCNCDNCGRGNNDLVLAIICLILYIIYLFIYISDYLTQGIGKKNSRYFSLTSLTLIQLVISILSFFLSSKFHFIKIISPSLFVFNLLGELMPNINRICDSNNIIRNNDIIIPAEDTQNEVININPIDELEKKERGQNFPNDILADPSIDQNVPEITPENVPLLFDNRL